MSFIFINKKKEEEIRRALLQLKNEVPRDIYKEIERILLTSIMHKRLSINEVNSVLSLLNILPELKSEHKMEEYISKRYMRKKQKNRKIQKSFNFVLYEHLFIVRLLMQYKKMILCKPNGFQILKIKGRFLVMANPNACKNFRDSLKVTPSKSNAPKNTNANKNSSGGPGQKGNVGRTKGGNTR